MENVCIKKPESVVEKLHESSNEASYQISIGNLEEAQRILSEADQFAHDHC